MSQEITFYLHDFGVNHGMQAKVCIEEQTMQVMVLVFPLHIVFPPFHLYSLGLRHAYLEASPVEVSGIYFLVKHD